MYRPKHTVSKRRAGRILREIYACFFAALVIAFLMMPSGNVKAAGGGKGYPVDAFNGVWDFTEDDGKTMIVSDCGITETYHVK